MLPGDALSFASWGLTGVGGAAGAQVGAGLVSGAGQIRWLE